MTIYDVHFYSIKAYQKISDPRIIFYADKENVKMNSFFTCRGSQFQSRSEIWYHLVYLSYGTKDVLFIHSNLCSDIWNQTKEQDLIQVNAVFVRS